MSTFAETTNFDYRVSSDDQEKQTSVFCIWTYTYIHICRGVCVYIYICMYVCIYIDICLYIYRYIDRDIYLLPFQTENDSPDDFL
jgi:hypothetical protein